MEKVAAWKFVPSVGFTDKDRDGANRDTAVPPMTSFNPTVSTILIILLEKR